jgi:LruC domain-containing protein
VRISSQTNLSPLGGAPDGEVEDYPVDVSAAPIQLRHYPNRTNPVLIAFEDNWPQTADYDMNDFVVALRFTEVIDSTSKTLTRIDIHGQILAMGGSYRSGFGIHLPGVLCEAVDNDQVKLTHNGIAQPNPLEPDRKEAIFLIANDVRSQVASNCPFFRTQEACKEAVRWQFELQIPFAKPVDLSAIPEAPYNPFLFGTPGAYRGPSFATPPGRSLEIHLADHVPTEAFNSAFLTLAEDTSQPSIGRFFRNANNLPWAIEVFHQWRWPTERSDLSRSYPQFATFIQGAEASNPREATEWHLAPNPLTGFVY